MISKSKLGPISALSTAAKEFSFMASGCPLWADAPDFLSSFPLHLCVDIKAIAKSYFTAFLHRVRSCVVEPRVRMKCTVVSVW